MLKKLNKKFCIILAVAITVLNMPLTVSAATTRTINWTVSTASNGTSNDTLGIDKSVTFNLTYTPSTANIKVGIINTSTNAFTSINGTGGNAKGYVNAPQAGTYKVRVVNNSSSSVTVTGSYTINDYAWYSDGNVAHFYEGTPKVKVSQMQTSTAFSRTYLEGEVGAAVNLWNTSALPVSFVSGSGESNANIYVRGGKPDYLTDTFGVSLLSGGGIYNGLAAYSGSSSIKSISIGGVNRDIRKATGTMYIYIVNKTVAGTFDPDGLNISYNARSTTGHTNTVRHEIGHSLGFRGHSIISGDLMENGTSNTSLMGVSAQSRIQITQFRTAYLNDVLSSVQPFNSEFFSPELPLIDEMDVNSAELISSSDDFTFDIKNNGNVKAEYSAGDKMAYMSAYFGSNSNIMIGTPVEITLGSEDAGISDDAMIIVDYLFQVTDNLTGSPLPEYITVRSQLGNVFELGKEYCISPFHINNTLWDSHIIYDLNQVIEADLLTKGDITSLKNAAEIKSGSFTAKKSVTENASLSTDFISNVDLAVELTVTAKYNDGYSDDIFDIGYNLNSILTGNEYAHLLPELLRIKSDVEIGGTYLVMLDVINNEYVLPSSRIGAVVDANTSAFSEYSETFSGIAQSKQSGEKHEKQ